MFSINKESLQSSSQASISSKKLMASPPQSPSLPSDLPSDLPSPPHTSDLSSTQLRPHLRPPVARPRPQLLPPLARPRTPPPFPPRPPPPPPPPTQVFVSFRGTELRNGFVSHVVKALRLGGVNVFIDSYEQKGRDLQNLFTRIDNSKVALVIFSDRFSQSNWCLNELVRIDERVKEKKLVVIPVFYRVSTDDVKQFRGKFGNYFVETVQGQSSNEPPMAERWMAAVKSIASKTGFTSEVHRMDSSLVDAIVRDIRRQVPVPISKKQEKRSIIEEVFLAGVLAFVCQFIAPLVFDDVSFYKTPQWFVGVLFLIVVRWNFS